MPDLEARRREKAEREAARQRREMDRLRQDMAGVAVSAAAALAAAAAGAPRGVGAGRRGGQRQQDGESEMEGEEYRVPDSEVEEDDET